MSQSLYHNPFMPTRHLNPRASGLIVFGGGGGGGTVYTDVNGGQHATEALAIASNTAINEANIAAEAAAVEAKKVADAKAVEDARLLAVQKAEEERLAAVAVAEQKKRDEEVATATALAKRTGKAASDLTSKVYTDPSAVVKASDVKTIDTNAPGTNIDSSVGQITGTAAQMRVADAPDFRDFMQGNVPGQMLASDRYAPDRSPMRGDEDPSTYMQQRTAAAEQRARSDYQIRYGKAADATAAAPDKVDTSKIDASTVTGASTEALTDVNAKQGTVSTGATVTAATMDPTTTAVSNLTAQQGESTILNNPVKREIQAGEIISGVADAEKAAAFTEQIQAATATPSAQATVQGQLSGLMQNFEGGKTPAWAAGAMRSATAAMAQRGLGSSSMAGQAIIQATMEAALPIAMADAQTIASFEAQNLSNRQQRAMLAAQQRAAFIGQEFDQEFQARVQNASRVSEIANINFTAEQQIALENSRTSNTMNLANLNNKQAMVMAQAAAVSGLETQNLSNQQQAAVQNAASFLQMDMANLSNSQQTELFKAQAIQQSLLTDAAAENAGKQFNATSENQTKQFMSSLNSQVSQFNASQANAMTQFREGETNAAEKFNASIREQRSQFNASNSLVIAQANAQWRQNSTTINTAAQNTANMEFAKQVNGLTNKSIDEIWQRERDMMDMYFSSEEKKQDRVLSLLLGDKEIEASKIAADSKEATASGAAKTNLLLKLFWPF